MNTLHIVNDKNKSVLAVEGDAVLFIENGVYTANDKLGASSYFVLASDCLARAVQTPKNVSEVDYTGFVELCTRYSKVVTW